MPTFSSFCVHWSSWAHCIFIYGCLAWLCPHYNPCIHTAMGESWGKLKGWCALHNNDVSIILLNCWLKNVSELELITCSYSFPQWGGERERERERGLWVMVKVSWTNIPLSAQQLPCHPTDFGPLIANRSGISGMWEGPSVTAVSLFLSPSLALLYRLSLALPLHNPFLICWHSLS